MIISLGEDKITNRTEVGAVAEEVDGKDEEHRRAGTKINRRTVPKVNRGSVDPVRVQNMLSVTVRPDFVKRVDRGDMINGPISVLIIRPDYMTNNSRHRVTATLLL